MKKNKAIDAILYHMLVGLFLNTPIKLSIQVYTTDKILYTKAHKILYYYDNSQMHTSKRCNIVLKN